LQGIKLGYGLRVLEPIQQGEHWTIHGEINPTSDEETVVKVDDGHDADQVKADEKKPKKGTPEGDKWRYERYKSKGGTLSEEEWHKRSRGGRSGGPGHQEIQSRLKEHPAADTEVQVGDRFADGYWPKGPDGKPVYHQIGGLNPERGDPIARERRAIDDIRREVGSDVDIYFWDKTKPNSQPIKNPDLSNNWISLEDD
jgi:hypothetical protein